MRVKFTRGGGGAETGAGGTNMNFSASSAFAAAVPSAWHTGQFTVNGIRPPIGSTSNLNFCPRAAGRWIGATLTKPKSFATANHAKYANRMQLETVLKTKGWRTAESAGAPVCDRLWTFGHQRCSHRQSRSQTGAPPARSAKFIATKKRVLMPPRERNSFRVVRVVRG